jgi:hypothetical protein
MLVLSSLLVGWSASKADAQTACQADLDALESAITSATFTNSKDQANLLNKVQNAETKLSEGKTEDAVGKITDIRTGVAKLAAGGKLGANDAQAIDAAAAAAIQCLQPSTGT